MAAPVAALPVRHRTRSTAPSPQTRPHPLANAIANIGLRVVYRPIDELHDNPRNVRRHSKKQLTQLAASIQRYGFNSPVLIDPSNTLIAGHARVAAARMAGLNEVPTIFVSHLDPLQLRAFMLADNKLAEGAEWDFELLKVELAELCVDLNFSFEAIGFDAVEADFIIHGGDESADSDTECDEGLPPLRKVAITRLGDKWQLGRHVFVCGDARDPGTYALLLGADKAQLVIADAPYNVPIAGHVSGLGKHKHREFAVASGEMTRPEFISFLKTTFGLLANYSVDGALHYLFMDHRHLDEILAAGGEVYDERKNLLVWKKTNAGMGSLYRSQHELIFVYKHGSVPHINNVQLGSNGRYHTNVLEYAGANTFRAGRDEELVRHPTPKPVPLIADLIRDASNINDLVLDGFVGGGTIFVAAERTHRRAAGIEIDPLYCDLSTERWQALTGQSAVLVETGQTFAEVAASRLGASHVDGVAAAGERP